MFFGAAPSLRLGMRTKYVNDSFADKPFLGLKGIGIQSFFLFFSRGA